MECGDLERYLEAFLDGRLSQSRAALLRRHLRTCGSCQTRVERLRQFERDTQRRFRALDRSTSVWQGLELDLVVIGRSTPAGRLLALPRMGPKIAGEAFEARRRFQPRQRRELPPPATTGRGMASRLTGALLIAMALGSLYQLARSYARPADDLNAAADVYMQFRQGTTAPTFRGHDIDQLRGWLAGELGTSVPMPPLPPGYHLIGADRASLPSGLAGAVLYGTDPTSPDPSVMLFIRPAPEGRATAASEDGHSTASTGLNELVWSAEGFDYTLVGQQPPADLKLFVHH